jgi:hypothetical protein
MLEAYLFRLEANPPAYLWSGVGDLDVPGDALVGSATTRYSGIGTLTGIPVLQNLINGTADRAEFTLSGVDALAMQYAHEDSGTIPGSIVRIGSVPLGDDGQVAGPTDWEWEGVADTIAVSSQGQDGGGRVRSVTISVGTATVARSTASLSSFTDAIQRQLFPTDAFFSHIAGINAGTSRRFGVRS